MAEARATASGCGSAAGSDSKRLILLGKAEYYSACGPFEPLVESRILRST
jgi:hypothetical protein